MPRPTMCRKVSYIPDNREFKPCTKASKDVYVLKVEEVEALRLKDIENLHQSECAQRMNVSRQTFQLILDCARTKTAKAIVNGTRIVISGGDYNYTSYQIECLDCQHHYKSIDSNENCPKCGSMNTKVKEEQIVAKTNCKKKCCKRR